MITANKRERALWIAAERLSNFEEGQGEIFSDLLKTAEEESDSD